MSMLPLQLQIISDLHLETPLISPSYASLDLAILADICLLGDIGLVKDDGLFAFLRSTLGRYKGHRVFYVIGNHEAYQMSYGLAVEKLRDFENEAKADFGGRFILLNRDRFDINSSTTILGCTLWSEISAEQANEARLRLTDFNEMRGIQGWSLEDHLAHHRRDLEWLNAQVQELEEEEPHRQVVILTHHSPTMDARATDPRHRESSLSTCFATDLTTEPCWTSSMVNLWAFGHTHYSCTFRDEGTSKLIAAKQKGYQQFGNSRGTRRVQPALLELDQTVWKIVKPFSQRKLDAEPESPHQNTEPLGDTSFRLRKAGGNDRSVPQRSVHKFLSSLKDHVPGLGDHNQGILGKTRYRKTRG